jgi:hypothetical protein
MLARMADPMRFDPMNPTLTQNVNQSSGSCPCCAGGAGDPAGVDLQNLLSNPNFIQALLGLAQRLGIQPPGQSGMTDGQQQPGQQPQIPADSVMV